MIKLCNFENDILLRIFLPQSLLSTPSFMIKKLFTAFLFCMTASFTQASDFTLLCKGKSINIHGKIIELKIILKKEGLWIYRYYYHANEELFLGGKSRIEISPIKYEFGRLLGRDFNGPEDKSESWYELNRQTGVLNWHSINTREDIFDSSSKIVNKTIKYECEKYNLTTKF